MSKKKTSKAKNLKKGKPKAKTTSGKLQKNRSLLITLGLILGFVGLLIYANTFGHDYALDDYSAIKENFVTKKGVAGLGDIFTKHYRYGYWNSPGTLYRPVSLAMFAVEWQIAPDSPGLYHFVNVLLYAFTGFFLFWTLTKLMPDKSPLLPFLATLIFISHPLHVEVVANIKSRDEIVSFLCCIIAIYSYWKYLKFDKVLWLGYGVTAYLIAMFSKESAITFLAVFPLIAYFFLKKNISDSVLKSLVFLIPVVIYLFTRSKVLGNVFAGSTNVPILDNVLADAANKGEELATGFVFAGKYLKNLFIPHPLGSDFGFPQYTAVGWGDWRAILSFLLFAGMGFLAIKGFKKRKILSFSILYFIITFSIFSNLVILIGTSYGDRLMYVPSLGFAIAIAYLIIHFTKTDTKVSVSSMADFFAKFKIPLLIVGVIALAFSIKTITRNPVWENSYTLYEADIEVAPNSAKLNYHYGLELNKRGNDAVDQTEKRALWEKALASFNKAIELYPKYSDAYGQRGLFYYRVKNAEQAIKDYQTSIGLKPNAKVYSNMGTIFFETGRVAEAIDAYKNAVKYDPRFVDARRNLGSAYAMNKQFNLALKEYQEALKYDPDNPTINYYIGTVYRDLGDQTNSKIWLEKAYQLDPSLRK